MIQRTTIEIDEDLLIRARAALGVPTARAAVEEALKRAVADSAEERAMHRARQLRCLETLEEHVDMDVLASREMWR